MVWDASDSVITQSDIPTSETIYDADSHPIENVTPPGVPGTDEPMVTASAFDPDGRLVSTSIDATDGYSASVLGTSGLLDYWPLDEHGGTAADDRKGSNDGAYTTTGVDLGVAGGVDEARTGAELDGATGRVNVADSSSLDLTGNLSIEYWIKPDVTLTTGAPSQWAGGVNKMNAYGIGWEGTDDGWQFKLTAGGTAHTAVAANMTAQAGQWYHIVGTYDGGPP